MDIDKCREEFDKEMLRIEFEITRHPHNSDEYFQRETQVFYAVWKKSWQAAQASIATPQPQPQTVRDALEIGLLENKLMQAMEGLRRCADPYEKGPRVIAERTLRNIDKTKSAKPHLIEPLSADEQKEHVVGPEWQDISTADLTDDLIWLFDGVDSIEGPRCLETDDYDRYAYWAECTWPSTLPVRNSHE